MVDRNLNAILIGHDDKPNDLADAIRPLLSELRALSSNERYFSRTFHTTLKLGKCCGPGD